MSANFDRTAAFTRDLAEVVSRKLQAELSLPPEQAGEIGMACAQEMCDEFGGELIYVGKGWVLQISERDRELHAYYVKSGRNIVATAKQFDLGVQAAYKRVRLFEAAEFNSRQGALFGDDACGS
ncbi:MAG: hypothetical protein J0I77_09530 [Rudaea sp.]|uniref:Mor transcription activator family protein n=1 Tax=unclassified Rudaea TaxID=2627037 RepID=UPI0010F867E1|nr:MULTISPECIES: Mor transcription activator family protein [unclassified Rudaea]MBN8885948.1 hypothetical protein [Rudaea sp.]MBR0347048.1 hypothetical protein [Rudaea sp.]